MKTTIQEYKYKIFPLFNKVTAEIIIKPENYDFYFHALSKSFGSIFRKPIEADYLAAEKWAKNQIRYIENANKK